MSINQYIASCTSIANTRRGVYPYLPMATNAPWSILGGMKKFNIKSVDFVHKFIINKLTIHSLANLALLFLGLWTGVNPERLACLHGRPLHRSIDAACILEQESPADATVTRDSAIIPICPPATILDFIEPQIVLAPFDPLTPKTIT